MNPAAAAPLPHAPLTRPLSDSAAWTALFRTAEIPVLARTAEMLEALRQKEDEVDANSLGEVIAGDPLMSLKVLVHAAAHRGTRVVTDVETVTAALVMTGISPFFAAFGAQPTVEQRLAELPEALDGLTETIRRAHRSANFALAFAVHRMDHDAAVIHAAALLHDFAAMLLWCHAPTLAVRVRKALRADPTLRSNAAQRAVLGIELDELQQSLMKAWRLPDLLVRIGDADDGASSAVRSVALAVRLARHSAEGWENAAIPDDIEDIAKLLTLSPEAAQRFVRDV